MLCRPGIRAHRDEPSGVDHARRPVDAAGRLGRPPHPEHGMQGHGSRGRCRARTGRAGRSVDPRTPGDDGVPQQSGRDRGHARCARLAAYGGHRIGGCRWLPACRGPAQGADQVQGVPGCARRARGPSPHAPSRGRRRRDPLPGSGSRRGPKSAGRTKGHRHAGRAHGIREPAGGAVQEDPAARRRESDPEEPIGKNPAPRAGGARTDADRVMTTAGTGFRPGERFAEMESWQQPTPGEPGIWNALGWRRAELDAGRAVLEWEPNTDQAFPAGDGWFVHGGMGDAVLPRGLGSATWSLLDRDEVYLPADLRTEFYRPARPGRIRATGWVVRKTRRVTFAASELHDEAGTLLASCRATNITIDLRDEPQRARRGPARPVSD